jgi:hypothetical protein
LQLVILFVLLFTGYKCTTGGTATNSAPVCAIQVFYYSISCMYRIRKAPTFFASRFGHAYAFTAVLHQGSETPWECSRRCFSALFLSKVAIQKKKWPMEGCPYTCVAQVNETLPYSVTVIGVRTLIGFLSKCPIEPISIVGHWDYPQSPVTTPNRER